MTDPEHIPQDAIVSALERAQFGVALLDENFTVLRRAGALSDWLPATGGCACAAPALLHMEQALTALRAQGGEFVLPALRLATAPQIGLVTIAVFWDAAQRRYVAVTTPDRSGEQFERLLASDRREKLMLRQQTEAAVQRLSIADALYRDIVESSGVFVLRFRGDLKIIFANELAARFLARPREALYGRSVAALFPGVDEGAVWRVDMCAHGPALFEQPARDASGAPLWLGWEVGWIDSDGGGEFQAVGREVSAARLLRVERKKAHEAAREASLAAERLRIANDLHDTLVRSIVTLLVQMRALARKLADAATRNALDALVEGARDGLNEARAALTQLRAMNRKDSDPKAIVEAFALRLREEQGLSVEAALDAPLDGAPAALIETLARVLREALRNIELHSAARHVVVTLARSGDALRLEIVDDGVGFEPASPHGDHYGLVGMKERAAAIGATLAVVSAPGEGARVTLTAPLAKG